MFGCNWGRKSWIHNKALAEEMMWVCEQGQNRQKQYIVRENIEANVFEERERERERTGQNRWSSWSHQKGTPWLYLLERVSELTRQMICTRLVRACLCFLITAIQILSINMILICLNLQLKLLIWDVKQRYFNWV